jgi:signal transduction histidine kinase/HAMP domain-containing protein
MRRLVQALRSQIKYTVILPYLLLMIIVMLVGSGVAVMLVAGSWQERFNNQLGQVARNFAEAFAQRELSNIQYLGQIVFTAPNAQTGAPAISEAIRDRDSEGLDQALKGLWQIGLSNENINQDRLVVFDQRGLSLADWERSPLNPVEPTKYVGTNLSELPLVQAVLRGELAILPDDETLGDKYSGLIRFQSIEGAETVHFFTVVPVYAPTTPDNPDQRTVVGGIMVAQRLDNLLQALQRSSQSAISTIYDVSGTVQGTTATGVTIESLAMSPELVMQVAQLNTFNPEQPQPPPQQRGRTGDAPSDDICLDIANLTGRLVTPLDRTTLPACSVNTTQIVADREYQFVYAPLLIRGVQSGFFSVSLSRDFVLSAWASSRNVVIGITVLLALSSVVVGYGVARQITRPLDDLVTTAEAVTAGDLARRSTVAERENNELGQLSVAFNQMTAHLLQLYTASRELNSTIESQGVLHVATTAAAAFVPNTIALALLEDADGFRFNVPRDHATNLNELSQQRLPADTPLLLALAAQDPETPHLLTLDAAIQHTAGLSEAGFATVLAAPIYRQRQLAGALLFAHTSPDVFTETDIQRLDVVANMTVTVLANAMLYGQVQREAKQRQAILTSIGDGVVVCDDKGRIVLLNYAAETMLELPNWRTTRTRFADLPLEAVEKSRELFGALGDQFRLGERYITLSRAPVVDEDGAAAGEVIVLHDVTDAIHVDKAKTDFIATISHELRTPLTVIRGYVELLLRGTGGAKPTTDQTELLETVRARAVDMTDMVNNAILIADIETGKLQTELAPQDLELVLSMALTPLRAGFEAKQLSLTLDIPADLPPVFADREQLRQVFGQLLDNARRYTTAGGVTIRARASSGSVIVAISDTGQGIAPDVLPRLFKRFQRIEGNNSAQRGGGLGLAITRQLIERQGGTVHVESTPGSGSTFTITLVQAHEQSLAVAQSEDQTTTPS